MPSPEQNLRNARAFLQLALDERQGEEAIELYAGDVYVQHNPNVADGKEGFIAMVEEVFVPMPKEIRPPVLKKSIATEDHVVLFNHVVDPTGGPGRALVDIFRFDADGKIVEHWDIVQTIPSPSDFKHANGFF